jgi:hypothetical protein
VLVEELPRDGPASSPLQSAELSQILKEKPARLSAHNVKGYSTFIESSEFDGSKAKLSCYRRDSCAGICIIARYEYDLPLPSRVSMSLSA